MKKLLFTCFLALSCLFQKARIKLKAIKERLGLLNPPTALRCKVLIKYLAAGVFHVAKRSVSRAVYLKYPIPNCIPVYFILIGICCTSPSQSQVADSPGADFPQRSVPNRGGETRSDTFALFNDLKEASDKVIFTTAVSAIDGGTVLRTSKIQTASLRSSARSDDPLPRSPDIGHRTSPPSSVFGLPSSKKETASPSASTRSDDPLHRSLVLNEVEVSETCAEQSRSSCLPSASIRHLPAHRSPDIQHRTSGIRHLTSIPSPMQSTLPKGVKKYDTSVWLIDTTQATLASPSILYGEVINPDSLAPLTLEVSPYYFSKKSRFMNFSLTIPMEEGTFFDGVVDPRVQKFRVGVEDLKETGLFSLVLGNRELLDDFLIRPGDSLKIGMDLLESSLVFGGPDAAFYEVQYLLKRMEKKRQLNEPRTLILASTASLFSDPKNDSLWKEANQEFGSRLVFQTYGKEGLEKVLKGLEVASKDLEDQLTLLHSFQNQLDPESFDLLQLEVYSRYYGPFVSTLYRFYFNELGRFLDAEEVEAYSSTMERILMGIREEGFLIQSKLISPAYLDLQLDKLTLLSLIRKTDFGTLVNESFSGPLKDRILAGFLSATSKRYPDPEKIISSLGEGVSHFPWKERVESLRNSSSLGLDVLPLQGENLNGQAWSSAEEEGKTKLYYFYFSTCPHSAHYFEDFLFPYWEEKGRRQGMELIAVSIDEDRELWRSSISDFSDTQIPNYRLSADSKSRFSSFYEVSGYPFTLLVDPQGKVRSFKVPASSYTEFEQRMNSLLESISVPDSALGDTSQ